MKRLRSKSYFVLPFVLFSFIFMGTYGCTPKQVDTAKSVFSKVSFYSNLARSLIVVAEAHYKDNPKVATALSAAKASLKSLETIMNVINAGLDYDESELTQKLAQLVVDVFELIQAIKDAKAAT